MKYFKSILIIGFLLFSITGINAQTYSHKAEVISSGGGFSTGGNYTNFGVIGETFVKPHVTGGNYTTCIGFIYMADSNACTNINEIFNYTENRIYPNPAKDKLCVEFKNVDNKVESLLLVNALGQIVYSIDGNKIKDKLFEIDLSGYKSGNYFLVLTSKKEKLSKQISVIR